MISDLKIRTNVLLSNFRFLETKSRRNIYNSNCNSFYGCELTNLMSKNLLDLDRTWRVSCRKILNINRRSHCSLLPGLMLSSPPSNQIKMRIFNFFRKGILNKDKFISCFFENCLLNENSIMFRNIRIISNMLKISRYKIQFAGREEVKLLINSDLNFKDYRVLVIDEILQVLDNRMVNGLSQWENKMIIDSLCLS